MSAYLIAPPAPDGELRRYVAVRHRLTVETPAADLERAVQALLQLCARLRCEVVSSSVGGMTSDSAPKGELSLRIAPEHLNQLFAGLGSAATIVMHATESEDKTGTVIDVDAKLKSLTGFRDNLRLMQGKSSATIKELVEIQRELSNVQSELDALLTKRKVLANETEKVAVDITFRSRESAGVLAPLASTFEELALTFFQSVAALVTVVVTALPWLLLAWPAYWAGKKLVRRFRRRRAPTV